MSQVPQYNWNEETGFKFPITKLSARVCTLACLIVSLAVLKTNHIAKKYGITYKDYSSYKYVFLVAIIGIVYSLVQIPSAIYYAKTKKHLIKSFTFVKFNLYADVMVVVLLAIGVGAAFGATMDLKKAWNRSDVDDLENFFTMNYVTSAFLLVACFTSAISSFHSSLLLTKDI